ncbi:hypothetical protein A2833_03125 [Candidatus Azambacteria bacterium RIFCSPHIGHO2_01_FULL_44_55]|uniref:Nucleoside 2-deoxyribosyltransferase n=1 Tax=Candidatus Azambacteria bacterium RIFCSPLOWO2_02_FULL_44_14 TaxID=1797306 RepID=A0A1F5CBF9_9BACT|nr:MAG: hypothetical protein A3A18_02440 [Candidatus Azambacteria bacterium RIFCSPLOWO2_01_FULL_44_84]OGD32723.1 MAG: hypothetical protein A3C78_01855 [Candidatus Azambacteria bacterium RIFCSPHIGHO2_02_FULL_45_18]OGD40176.1 MAG: hypothetical protein A3I30_02820 [Candidatus Azambacteria bacterium RIFCSPLOWO2_02_FULL_44_14]OGD41708.1 MAG: hypothetical protein A2833_03125 [Candidatus Azambacteria bacterium RIFCSPHIGHO2_01_FULL_44_55]OGD50073.1 MAG: hypothetical protein A2608_03430 [Candidatus Azam
MGKKIFVICPVRNVSKKVRNKIDGYVYYMESNGYEVYWPDQDNPYQNTDRVGFLICDYNRERMLEADEVHIWYDKNSIGFVFDLGMFFIILRLQRPKKFVIINTADVKPTPHKSFENVLIDLSQRLNQYFQKDI